MNADHPLTRAQISRVLSLLHGPEGVHFLDKFLAEGLTLEDLSSIEGERLEQMEIPPVLIRKIDRWQSATRLIDSPRMIKLARRYFMTLQYTVGMQAYQQDDFLAAATVRYKKWLYLKKLYRKEKLYMPRDIYFIYVVHELHPFSYSKMCRELFGTLVRPEEILSLSKHKLKTQELWHQTFNEDLDASYQYYCYQTPDPEKMVEVEIDLALGGKNQATYYGKMQHVALTDEYLKTAIKEYKEFLNLRKKLNLSGKAREIIVPTLRQDLIWHTHMMHPLSYAVECLAEAGEYMDHNDFLDDSTLKVQFAKTQQKFNLK